MRWMICVMLMIAVPFSVCALQCSCTRIAHLEDSMEYSMGLAGEARLISDLSEGSRSNAFSRASESFELSEGELEVEEDISEEERWKVTVFPQEESNEVSERIAKKIPGDYEYCYKDFAFAEDFPALYSPLTLEEVVYVFAGIVATEVSDVPLRGELEEITFLKTGDVLCAYARVKVFLAQLAAEYHVSGLPETATFSIDMIFSLKNSEISVDYDKISIRCESIELPEALLVFGCNLVFGRKDYKYLLGNAVVKVFANARFYP